MKKSSLNGRVSGGPRASTQEAQLGPRTKADMGVTGAVYGSSHAGRAHNRKFSPPRGSPIMLTSSGKKLGFGLSLSLTRANLP